MTSNAVDAMTSRWLDAVWIEEGMRVLDIGCVPGVVTADLAARVGPRGRVVAVDREPRVLEMCRDRVRVLGLSNVDVIEGTFEAPGVTEPVDVSCGRRVLMYQPDPVASVRALARVVRPDGLVWFHEHDTTRVPRSGEDVQLHDDVRRWLRAMLRNEGAHLRMGFELEGVLRAAGLAVEGHRAEANLLTPLSTYPIADIVRAVLPRLTGPGIATADAIDVETLDARLVEERRAVGGTIMWELVFCVWARTATDHRVELG